MSDDSLLGQSRRTFVKQSALATAVAGLGGTGLAAAQEVEGGKAIMYPDQLYPGALFRVVSGPRSDVPEAVRGSGVFSEFAAYTVEYLNTGEQATLYVADSAEIAEGLVYSLEREFDVTEPEGNLVTVDFEPVQEDEVGVTDDDDDDVFDGDVFDDFDIDDADGGKALLFVDQYYPGSLVRIVSGPVDATPDYEAVRGSGVFSEFTTYFGRYLNTGEQINVFVADSAEVAEGQVYQVEGEFDVTEPEGNLVTVSLEGIDEDTLTEVGAGVAGDGGNRTGGNQSGNATGS